LSAAPDVSFNRAEVCGGGAAKVMRFEQPHALLGDAKARTALFEKINGMDRVLAVRLFEVDTAATTISDRRKRKSGPARKRSTASCW